MPKKENMPPPPLLPQNPCFLMDQNFFKKSDNGSTREYSCEILSQIKESSFREDFSNISLYAIKENRPCTQNPCFSKDKNFLKESG